jgi:hypothetical protein
MCVRFVDIDAAADIEQAAPGDRSNPWRRSMDSAQRDLMMKTWELIETTRDEVLRLREEIELARKSIDRSQRLLSRTGPSADRGERPAKPL